MIFKSLLLTLGLLQNQEQAALLSANKTIEADKALEVCPSSDAWKYISPRQRQEDFFKDAKLFLTYAVPASFALSAVVFYEDHVYTQALMQRQEVQINEKRFDEAFKRAVSSPLPEAIG
jgi:hypothetical protein